VIDTGVPAAPPAPTLLPADDSGFSNSDNITNVTTPRFFGTAQPFATVTIFEQLLPSGALIADGSAAANGAGNYVVRLTTPLADGSYSIYAQQANAAGNIGPKSTPLTPLVIDTTPPAAPTTPNLITADDTGLSNSDHVTYVTTPHFSGLAEGNSFVQIFVNGAGRDQAQSDNLGNYLVQIATPLASGTYTITARATDVAGNQGPFSTAMSPSLVVDTSTPAAPSVPSLLNADDSGRSNTDHITNVTTPRFAGTALPNAQVNLFINGVSRGSAIADSTGKYQVQVSSALADGTYTVTAGQTDVAGISSALSAAMVPPLVIVSSAPAPNQPTLVPNDDTGLSNSDHITFIKVPHFTGVVEPNALVSIFAAGVTLPIGTVFADSVGNYTAQVGQYVSTPPAGSLTSLADGTYTITVQQLDVAGNTSPMSPPLSPNLVINTVKPVAPSVPNLIPADDTGVSNSDHITRVRTPHFQGTAGANNFVQIFANNVLRGTGFADGSGNYLVQIDPLNPLADGTYTITAEQTDVAGNVSPKTAAMQPLLVIDTTPLPLTKPALLTADDTGISNSDNITKDNTPRFTGGGADAGNTVLILANGTVVGHGSADASGNWTVMVSATSPLADGSYSITAEQVDSLGRPSLPSPALSPVVIDTVALAPANVNVLPSDDTGVSNSDHITKVRTPHITGTAEANASVTISVNGTAANTGTAASNGSFSIQLTSALADGTYTIQASQTDVAGNVSVLSPAMMPLLVIDTRPAISGRVFNDLNGDGSQETGEAGLQGWTVFLDTNGNGTLEAGEPSTLTDANGNYNFNVNAGTYKVREVLQSGWTKTTVDVPSITVSTSDVSGGNFGNFQQVSISGRAFTDTNGNGNGAGNPGLNAIQIQLYRDVNGNGVLDAGDTLVTSMTTAPVSGQNGLYSFTGVGPGQYIVHEVVPAGYVLTAPGSGDYAVTTSSGFNLTGFDFGNFQTITVSGHVFTDLNGSGNVAGDPGQNGVTVQLYRDNNANGLLDASDTLVASTTTANVAGQDGSYSFTGVGAGHYLVHQALAAGVLQTLPSSGADYAFATMSGTNISARDFGDFVLGAISGQVFQDTTGNGVNNGTTGLAGWTVQLLDTNNNVVESVSTDGSGNYTLGSVAPGTYHIREVVQSGWLQTTANPADVTVNASGAAFANVNFGDFRTITVSGRAYNDLNIDGTDDGGTDPGIANQKIQLYRDVNANGVVDAGDTLVATVTTPGNGQFSFTGVGPGKYVLQELHVAGAGVHQITPPAPGVYAFTATSGADQPGDSFGNIANANEAFVYQAYLDVLGRPVDLGGLNYWTGLLNSGTSRTAVVAGIQASPEYLVRTINSVYQTYLGRPADQNGINFGIQVLTNQAILIPGASVLDQLKAVIIGSPEYFQNHGGTNAGFLAGVFLDVLNRPIDPQASAYFQGLLAQPGNNRTLIAKQILTTPEAKSVLVNSYYLKFLHRQADPTGLAFWTSYLVHGGNENALIQLLVGSQEYYNNL
jgi:hypothetical protein